MFFDFDINACLKKQLRLQLNESKRKRNKFQWKLWPFRLKLNWTGLNFLLFYIITNKNNSKKSKFDFLFDSFSFQFVSQFQKPRWNCQSRLWFNYRLDCGADNQKIGLTSISWRAAELN
jgi:hypothetical protein